MAKHETVDDYIASFPDEVAAILTEIRHIVREEVPGGEEVISYGIPTVKLNGRYLVYFAGWKRHVSLYPLLDEGDLVEELAPYRSGRGTAKFPIDEPIPYDLIRRMVARMARPAGGDA
jgi:uncharacterized protein YdhG (YjbR/CyaY superfamily)